MVSEKVEEPKPKNKARRSSLRKSLGLDPSGFFASEVDLQLQEIWMNPRNHSVFEFQDISYVVGKGKKQKKILSNVSGYVSDGSTVAILGPSGAGKTSLLKALSLGITSVQVLGSIELNGKKLTNQVFKDHCFLVEQYDHHWPFLTCKETLMYGASLLLGSGYHSIVVENIIDKMGL